MAVVTHHLMSFHRNVAGGGINYWISTAKFAVPCFLMITGWIWLDENKTFDTRKCLKRVLLPLLSFGYVFALLDIVYNERKIIPSIFIQAFFKVISGNIWPYMWYLYMLVGLYLVMPTLKLLINNTNRKQQQYMIIILIIFTILFPSLKSATGFETGFYLPVQTPYLLYLLLGNYLSKWLVPTRYAIINLFCAYVSVFLSTFIWDCELPYSHFAILWLSSAYFILALSLQPVCENINGSVVCYIGRKTFGIYILHEFFIKCIFMIIKFDPFVLPSGVNWLILTVVVFALSFLTTVVIQKIPIINKIFCV